MDSKVIAPPQDWSEYLEGPPPRTDVSPEEDARYDAEHKKRMEEAGGVWNEELGRYVFPV